jgi:hypothetical protein
VWLRNNGPWSPLSSWHVVAAAEDCLIDYRPLPNQGSSTIVPILLDGTKETLDHWSKTVTSDGGEANPHGFLSGFLSTCLPRPEQGRDLQLSQEDEPEANSQEDLLSCALFLGSPQINGLLHELVFNSPCPITIENIRNTQKHLFGNIDPVLTADLLSSGLFKRSANCKNNWNWGTDLGTFAFEWVDKETILKIFERTMPIIDVCRNNEDWPLDYKIWGLLNDCVFTEDGRVLYPGRHWGLKYVLNYQRPQRSMNFAGLYLRDADLRGGNLTGITGITDGWIDRYGEISTNTGILVDEETQFPDDVLQLFAEKNGLGAFLTKCKENSLTENSSRNSLTLERIGINSLKSITIPVGKFLEIQVLEHNFDAFCESVQRQTSERFWNKLNQGSVFDAARAWMAHIRG